MIRADLCNGSTMAVSCNGVTTNYSAYICPYPLTGLANSCDPEIAGIPDIRIVVAIPPALPAELIIGELGRGIYELQKNKIKSAVP